MSATQALLDDIAKLTTAQAYQDVTLIKNQASRFVML